MKTKRPYTIWAFTNGMNETNYYVRLYEPNAWGFETARERIVADIFAFSADEAWRLFVKRSKDVASNLQNDPIGFERPRSISCYSEELLER